MADTDTKDACCHDFKVGDVVCLKSGGPCMTVTCVGTCGRITATHWCCTHKSYEDEHFPCHALKKCCDEDDNCVPKD